MNERLRQDRKINFIWITREVPLNPDSGLLIYSSGLIRGLLKAGAVGKLVAFARPEAGGVNVSGLTVEAVHGTGRHAAFSLASKWYSDSWRFKSKEFQRVLRRLTWDDVDAVVIDYFSMGWVLDIIENELQTITRRPILVHISHNYESLLRLQVAESQENRLKRWIMRFDARKAASMERRLVRASDLLVVNTDEDNARFRQDAPGKTILTLTPGYDGEIQPTRPITAAVPRRVVAVGSFDWIAKQAALRRFLEAAEGPFRQAGIEFLVVGRSPKHFIEELTAKHPFCQFTGRVEDVRAYVPGGRIGVVVDDIGGGFKHKFLYYIFGGVAAAALRSQISGLPIDSEHDIIARDSMEELVAAIVGAIDDIASLDGMRQRCWKLCAPAFGWDDRGQRLAEAIRSIRDERSANARSGHQSAL